MLKFKNIDVHVDAVLPVLWYCGLLVLWVPCRAMLYDLLLYACGQVGISIGVL